jgi:RNA polymerase sigma-70 factor (ECF subfamily)
MTLVPEAIFAAACRGDRQAVVRLLEIAQPHIKRYAQAACRTSADAEDAAQEALWLLSRRIGTVRSLAAISSWLFTVVRRECLRLARRAGLFPLASPEESELEAAFVLRPDAELRLDMAAAFESLPAHYRDVALMRDIKEMTIDEIAAALGTTRQAVKARLHRARLMMREYLTR